MIACICLGIGEGIFLAIMGIFGLGGWLVNKCRNKKHGVHGDDDCGCECHEEHKEKEKEQ